MHKHFTATAYIAAKIDTEIKILLHEHKKLNLWVGIGGHIETDENPAEAVTREVKEETSLEIQLISQTQRPLLEETEATEVPLPIMLLEELIPTYDTESTHIHIDHIYAAITKNPQAILMSEQFKWFNKSQIANLSGKTAGQIKEITDRVFAIVTNHL